jgi:hypothetical protein
MLATRQRTNRLDGDVRREDEEADRDELPSLLRVLRADARAGEEPENDEAGERLDQRVGAKPMSAIELAAIPAPTAMANSTKW